MSDMIRMSVEVDKETHQKLRDLAKIDRRSLGAYCAVILEKHAKPEEDA